jgi:hypothetical protein
VLLRLDTASSLDGGVRADEFDGEPDASPTGGDGEWSSRLEREKEARTNARRRRAAGNKQLRRQAEASEAASKAAETAGVDGVNTEREARTDLPSPSAQGDSAAATPDEARAEQLAECATVVAPPAPPPMMGMSNSIMFELED